MPPRGEAAGRCDPPCPGLIVVPCGMLTAVASGAVFFLPPRGFPTFFPELHGHASSPGEGHPFLHGAPLAQIPRGRLSAVLADKVVAAVGEAGQQHHAADDNARERAATEALILAAAARGRSRVSGTKRRVDGRLTILERLCRMHVAVCRAGGAISVVYVDPGARVRANVPVMDPLQGKQPVVGDPLHQRLLPYPVVLRVDVGVKGTCRNKRGVAGVQKECRGRGREESCNAAPHCCCRRRSSCHCRSSRHGSSRVAAARYAESDSVLAPIPWSPLNEKGARQRG
mmetsp:Transcript_10667/g.26120  ORF Transcript_10667/g.26120 Transcript_10667/m.26120 type:complete len:285 (-) Transcript_10667:292-1146(-)